MSPIELGSTAPRALPAAGRRPARLPELDILRFIAVSAVIVFHTGGVPGGTAPSDVLANLIRDGSWLGVDLFFVLSGFLVSGLLFQQFSTSGRMSLGRFLLRRGFKIYPAFYFLIACTWVAIRAMASPQVAAKKLALAPFLSELLFLQNYWDHIWGHTWSLAVEEHFYLLLTALFFFLMRGRGRLARLPMICMAIALVALGLRCVSVLVLHLELVYFCAHATHLRLDSLSFGVLLSYFYHLKPETLAWVGRHRVASWVGSLALVASVYLAKPGTVWVDTIGFTLAYLGFGGILLLSLPSAVPAPEREGRGVKGDERRGIGRLLAWVGEHSYSIYLWHTPIQVTLLQFVIAKLGVQGRFWLATPVFLLLSWGVGIAMAKLVELPTLRVRDRFFPSRPSGREIVQRTEDLRASALP